MNFRNFRKQFINTFKFKADERLHYVYRITEINTNISYIGSRSCNSVGYDSYSECINDLKTYGTSSYRKQFIKSHTHKFKFKILQIFDNTDDKMLLESFLHNKFNVKHNDKFWNKSNQTPNGFDTTGMKFSHSREHIKKRTETTIITMSEVGDDGLTKYQRAGIKANETKLKKDKNGLNQYQKLAKKAWITKKENGFEFTSENNPRLNTILIVDNHNKIIEIIEKAFTIFCKEHKYPMNAFRKSYVAKGKKLYINLDNGNLKKMKDTFEYNTFKGWYAIKYVDLSDAMIKKVKEFRK